MGRKMDAVMTEEQVVRYTRLTARRMEIVMHSGASWRPEYGQELEEIDAELAALRQHVDAALEAKEARTENAPADTRQLNAFEDYHKSFMSELQVLTDFFGNLLHGSATADEVSQQADQCFEHMDNAAARYWESQAPASEDDLLLDDMEHQQLKEETRQAYLNGGRTPYLYDIDGNEYYTTRDGVRHYTRVEG